MHRTNQDKKSSKSNIKFGYPVATVGFFIQTQTHVYNRTPQLFFLGFRSMANGIFVTQTKDSIVASCIQLSIKFVIICFIFRFVADTSCVPIPCLPNIFSSNGCPPLSCSHTIPFLSLLYFPSEPFRHTICAYFAPPFGVLCFILLPF